MTSLQQFPPANGIGLVPYQVPVMNFVPTFYQRVTVSAPDVPNYFQEFRSLSNHDLWFSGCPAEHAHVSTAPCPSLPYFLDETDSVGRTARVKAMPKGSRYMQYSRKIILHMVEIDQNANLVLHCLSSLRENLVIMRVKEGMRACDFRDALARELETQVENLNVLVEHDDGRCRRERLQDRLYARTFYNAREIHKARLSIHLMNLRERYDMDSFTRIGAEPMRVVVIDLVEKHINGHLLIQCLTMSGEPLAEMSVDEGMLGDCFYDLLGRYLETDRSSLQVVTLNGKLLHAHHRVTVHKFAARNENMFDKILAG